MAKMTQRMQPQVNKRRQQTTARGGRVCSPCSPVVQNTVYLNMFNTVESIVLGPGPCFSKNDHKLNIERLMSSTDNKFMSTTEAIKTQSSKNMRFYTALKGLMFEFFGSLWGCPPPSVNSLGLDVPPARPAETSRTTPPWLFRC